MEDECAEIFLKTEKNKPRDTFCECDRKEMTSFERLVHTAIALGGDPRDKHSYAYSDRKKSKEGIDKDYLTVIVNLKVSLMKIWWSHHQNVALMINTTKLSVK
jgi:hypothetical protein